MAVELAILRITRLRADSRSLRNGFVLARDFVFINKLYQVLQLYCVTTAWERGLKECRMNIAGPRGVSQCRRTAGGNA